MATGISAARGVSIVAGRERSGNGDAFRARDPRTGAPTGPEYRTATETDVVPLGIWRRVDGELTVAGIPLQ